ncbi:LOW QUALITY PROTEIN: putative beta-lactamase-like 1, partial [Galemys pyrenaicus]
VAEEGGGRRAPKGPPIRPSAVLSHCSSVGLPRRLPPTSLLLWKGSTQGALGLLKDDVLLVDPGTRSAGFGLLEDREAALSMNDTLVAFQTMSRRGRAIRGLQMFIPAHIPVCTPLLPGAVTARWLSPFWPMSWTPTPPSRWISKNVLEPLGMADTAFDLTPLVHARLATGFYGRGWPVPLYDLGWYRPLGQMSSTPMTWPGWPSCSWGLRRQDAAGAAAGLSWHLLGEGAAHALGAPRAAGLRAVRKDRAWTVPGTSSRCRRRPGLVLLLAGPRPPGADLVAQPYDVVLPAKERALREAERSPSPRAPLRGYFTFADENFDEVRAADELLRAPVEALAPPAFRTLALRHLRGRVFLLHLAGEFPCALPGDAWLSLEAQQGQLVNFYSLGRHGLAPGLDVPGLSTYRVLRLSPVTPRPMGSPLLLNLRLQGCLLESPKIWQ